MAGDNFPTERGFSDPILDYIGQILLEEEMEEAPSTFHDPLALQAAEKSFHDALAGETPLFPETHHQNFSNLGCSSSNGGAGGQPLAGECQVNSSSLPQPSFDCPPMEAFSRTSLEHFPTTTTNSLSGLVTGSSASAFVGASSSSNIGEPIWRLNRGVEGICRLRESPSQYNAAVGGARMFPHCENSSLITFEMCRNANEKRANAEGWERDYWTNVGRWRSKNLLREDVDAEEGRCSKQLAVNVEEEELSEMFDMVLLCPKNRSDQKNAKEACVTQSEAGILQQSVRSLMFHAGRGGGKTLQGTNNPVDLRSLLVLCTQAISSEDRENAEELLLQIRQHSSPFGDGNERFAHYFANALSARLDGSGVKLYDSWACERATAADILKAYQVYLLNCPFARFSIYFANHHILGLAEGAETLHIIDFGILYGFQWPIIIERLSSRPGGPPTLRITGIELPQPGFRPAERVEQTGRRLAKYCARFNVPFEYNAIAQKWDSIKIEDLKIRGGDKAIVNCMVRFKSLLDETAVVDSPRNAVLNFVRTINPHIFIHTVANGSYSAPFLVTRLREAMFHFSALYDMLDSTLGRENQERFMFEKELYGREAMNVIACEGSERVERPETYRQWQVRTTNAGFRQLPLDRELTKTVRAMVKSGYHKDFVIEEDFEWMLQGWKGRIFSASSCWVPG